jgi:hypothetical protein
MYNRRPNLILGFHGCSEDIAHDIITRKKTMKQSTNDYDWLGHGVYFWENNLSRAMSFANEQATRKQENKEAVIKPAVIGAVIDLGYCLDLLDSDNLSIVKAGYESLKTLTESQRIPNV